MTRRASQGDVDPRAVAQRYCADTAWRLIRVTLESHATRKREPRNRPPLLLGEHRSAGARAFGTDRY